jgi:membrane protein DedA with SNARE-associated domain
VLVIAKLSPGFAIAALVAAGLSKIPLRRWFPATFLAGVIWSTCLALVGFYATEAIKQVQTGLNTMALIGLAAVFALFLYLAHRGIRSTRSFVQEIDDEPGRLGANIPLTHSDSGDPRSSPVD